MLKSVSRTFRGGIHPPTEKQHTEKKPIEVMPPPERVFIPLRQHTGAPARAIVKAGDHVKAGQAVGKGPGFVTTIMHASISGEVVSIKQRNHPVFRHCETIEIKSDGKDEWIFGTAHPRGQADQLPPEDIKRIVTESGIVGLGGAAFPTHVKLSPPPEKKISLYILNGAECEPFLTADDRVMQERTEDIVLGLRLMMRAVGVARAIIAVEANKPDSLKVLKAAVSRFSEIEVVKLQTKYPQGSEKQLIRVVTGREIPRGGLPMDVGVAINNVGTALAVAEAVCDGKPLIERALTVTGSAIAQPKNLKVRLGALFKDVIEHCGGFSAPPVKILMGGPMMGIAQYTTEVPVIKGTSGIVALAAESLNIVESQTCIRCGRCVNACPMYLIPSVLGILCERHKFEEAKAMGLMDCVECGCCTYVCPAGRPMVHMFKFGKMELFKQAQKKREKEAK
ncbi:MAG: electron transport complex subunit RsxC [Candidatus Abyssobacteria bacterium SURF_5]|uniref:Ion-translocating oxidoreductase complex subunit C n=1 Tax=Abyssobacteria bacterium (strain SURF_5) TaxID=2093360 RepID=A0A3A4P0H9_ABYX5|nr:MAG: electron transport complex subunit RsxC [Candidatus Abyssubacteria bacterium SURF_5]